MTVFVELYGRLREAGLDNPLELSLPPQATAAEAIAALKQLMGPKATLIEGAALASESEVLTGQSPLPSTGRLALLPPVSGG